MIERLTGRKEWMFFAALPQAGGALAIAWWAAVVLRGVLPAVFAIAMGALVAAVQRGDGLTPSLAVVGAAFVLLQVLTPIQTAISLNLGDRTAAFLYDRLTAACVRPPGMGHLEDPSLTADMTAARDFDLGMTGPPLSYSMDFIAGGLVGMLDWPRRRRWCWPASPGGRRSCSAAPGCPRTGCCARAPCGTTARPTKSEARSATPTTPTGWPSIRPPARSCGCSAWCSGPSTASSRGARACTICSTRRRGCASARWCGAR